MVERQAGLVRASVMGVMSAVRGGWMSWLEVSKEGFPSFDGALNSKS
jgi:hypothetical protein